MASVERLTSIWATCEAESLGDATGTGLGSLGPKCSLAKGNGYSSQLSVHQKQNSSEWLQSKNGEAGEKYISSANHVPWGWPTPPSVITSQKHILTSILLTTKGSYLARATPPHWTILGFPPSPRRVCSWAPVALSGAACSERTGNCPSHNTYNNKTSHIAGKRRMGV